MGSGIRKTSPLWVWEASEFIKKSILHLRDPSILQKNHLPTCHDTLDFEKSPIPECRHTPESKKNRFATLPIGFGIFPIRGQPIGSVWRRRAFWADSPQAIALKPAQQSGYGDRFGLIWRVLAGCSDESAGFFTEFEGYRESLGGNSTHRESLEVLAASRGGASEDWLGS